MRRLIKYKVTQSYTAFNIYIYIYKHTHIHVYIHTLYTMMVVNIIKHYSTFASFEMIYDPKYS